MQGVKVCSRPELLSGFMGHGRVEAIIGSIAALESWVGFQTSSDGLAAALSSEGIETLVPSRPVKVCTPKRPTWHVLSDDEDDGEILTQAPSDPSNRGLRDKGFWVPAEDVVILHRAVALVRRITILGYTLVVVRDPRTLSALMWATVEEGAWIVSYTSEYQSRDGQTNQFIQVGLEATVKHQRWFRDLDYEEHSEPACVSGYADHSSGLKLVLYYVLRHLCQIVLVRLRLYLYLVEPVMIQENTWHSQLTEALLCIEGLCMRWFLDRRTFMVKPVCTHLYETGYLMLQMLLIEWDPRVRLSTDQKNDYKLSLQQRASRYIKRLGGKVRKLLRLPQGVFYEARGRANFAKLHGEKVDTLYISYAFDFLREGVKVKIKGSTQTSSSPNCKTLSEVPGVDFHLRRDHREIYISQWRGCITRPVFRSANPAVMRDLEDRVKVSLYVRACYALTLLCKHPYLGTTYEGMLYNSMEVAATMVSDADFSWDLRSRVWNPWSGCEYLAHLPVASSIHFISCYQMIQHCLKTFQRNTPHLCPMARTLVVLLWTPICGEGHCVTFYDFFRTARRKTHLFDAVCQKLDNITPPTWQIFYRMRVECLAEIEQELERYNLSVAKTLRYVTEDDTEPSWMDEGSS